MIQVVSGDRGLREIRASSCLLLAYSPCREETAWAACLFEGPQRPAKETTWLAIILRVKRKAICVWMCSIGIEIRQRCNGKIKIKEKSNRPIRGIYNREERSGPGRAVAAQCQTKDARASYSRNTPYFFYLFSATQPESSGGGRGQSLADCAVIDRRSCSAASIIGSSSILIVANVYSGFRQCFRLLLFPFTVMSPRGFGDPTLKVAVHRRDRHDRHRFFVTVAFGSGICFD